LGERRIRIGFAATLVGRRPLARRSVAAIAAVAIAPPAAVVALVRFIAVTPLALGEVLAVGTRLAAFALVVATARTAAMLTLLRCRGGSAFLRGGSLRAFVRRFRRSDSRGSVGAWLAWTRMPAWAAFLGAAAGTPDFDHLRFGTGRIGGRCSSGLGRRS